jgi:transcriptional regulator with XRE-family HTH domain
MLGQEEREMLNFPTIDMVKTGQNIMRLRDRNGFSVKNLQDVFGFTTPQAIYKWQRGTALPTVDNLVVLAVIFHVRIEDILVMDDNQVIQFSA